MKVENGKEMKGKGRRTMGLVFKVTGTQKR